MISHFIKNYFIPDGHHNRQLLAIFILNLNFLVRKTRFLKLKKKVTSGQQPYCPLANWQHVDPSGPILKIF